MRVAPPARPRARPARLARARARGAIAASAATLADEVRADFPILDQDIPESGKNLVYLDSAASSQKPSVVIDAHGDYYRQINANVHRGVHYLSGKATDAYEAARVKVAKFVNAASDREIVFTRNASEAINLVAYTWGVANLKPGRRGSGLRARASLQPRAVAARVRADGRDARHVGLAKDNSGIDMDELRETVNDNTKLIATAHVSNVLGCELDVPAVVELAKKHGAKVMLDACQSVPHMPVDVQALGVDWIVASGHKMCGPTGIGFLWGAMDVLESMPPWMGGGEMIQDVFMDQAPTRHHRPGLRRVPRHR